MIHTKVTLANMALTHLAHTSRIIDLNEESEEARTLSFLIDNAIEFTLRAGMWPFATKTAPLTLLPDDPKPGWYFTYKYPDDCALFHGFNSGQAFDNYNSQIPFQIGFGNTSSVIYCNQEQAIGNWTVKLMNPNRWPSDFLLSCSYKLAAVAAPGILKGNVGQLADLMDKRFNNSLLDALGRSLNEGSIGRRVPSESTLARR